MDIEKIQQEYKKIMLNLPEVYKVKYSPKAITQIQILAILKVQVIDVLKREKLVIVRLSNYLNYFIFTILMGLMLSYITFFYSYKDSHE